MLDQRFWSKVKFAGLNDCWEWQASLHPNGYGNFGVRIGKKRFPKLAHRVLMEDIHGPLHRWTLVRHKCDNKKCVNPLHLELGTHQDNMNDAKQRKQMSLGEKNARAKLTEKDIIDIRSSTKTTKELATIYNVSKEHINGIKRKRYWPHI